MHAHSAASAPITAVVRLRPSALSPRWLCLAPRQPPCTAASTHAASHHRSCLRTIRPAHTLDESRYIPRTLEGYIHVRTHPCRRACTCTHGNRLSQPNGLQANGLQASKPSTPRQEIEAWRAPRPTAGGEAAGGDDPATAPPPPLPEPPPPPPLQAPPPPPGQPPTLLNATAFLPHPDLPLPPTPPTPTLSPRGKSQQRRVPTVGQKALSGGSPARRSPARPPGVRPPSADAAERLASPGRRESLPGPWDVEAPSPGNRLSFPSEYAGLVERPSSGARGSRPRSATRPGSATRSATRLGDPAPAPKRGGLTLSLPVAQAQAVAGYACSLPRKGAPPSPQTTPRQRRPSHPTAACRSMLAASPRQGPRLSRPTARPAAPLCGSVLQGGEVSWAPGHRRGCARARRSHCSRQPPFLFDHSRPNSPPLSPPLENLPRAPLSPPLENLPRAPGARELRAQRWVAERREAPHRREPLRTTKAGSNGGGGGSGSSSGGGGRDWRELLDYGKGGAQQTGIQPSRRPRPVTLSVAAVGPGQGGPFAASVRLVEDPSKDPMRGRPMLGSHYE